MNTILFVAILGALFSAIVHHSTYEKSKEREERKREEREREREREREEREELSNIIIGLCIHLFCQTTGTTPSIFGRISLDAIFGASTRWFHFTAMEFGLSKLC